MNDLILVATFMTRLEAEFAKGYLEANGISAFVTADDQGGMYPFPLSPSPLGVTLLVSKSDRKKAETLLAKVKK